MKLTGVVYVCVCLFTCQSLWAQHPRQQWNYEKLKESADTIVIAKVESSEKCRARIEGMEETARLMVVETSLRVLIQMKGDKKEATLRLVHYEAQKGQDPGIQGFEFEQREMTVLFQRQKSGLVMYEPEYLVFLKARKDGRYECVSQDDDPRESIRLVVPPPALREVPTAAARRERRGEMV